MEDLFFIITERGEGIPSYIYPGRICYMKENRYLEEVSQESKVLPVKWLGSVVEYRVQVDSLHPVSKVEAALLQALDTDEERLDAFLNKAALEAAAGLKEGSSVFVEDMGKWHQGVVQYIGSRSRMLFPDCISGTFFRIKLQVCVCPSCVCVYVHV